MKPFLLSLPFLPAILLMLPSCQTDSDKKEPSKPMINAVPQAPTSMASLTPARPTPGSNGMITTASGLQYRVLAAGPAGGRSPGYSDTVMVHYHGTLTDGTIFDSSIQRGQPATFGVNQVIAGWTEALQLMKPGDKWLLHIPAHLAYGNRAVGDKIAPNSDLIFNVELLQVASGF